MGRIEQIKERLRKVKQPSNSYLYAAEKNQEWNSTSIDDVEYLLSRLQIAEKALTEIYLDSVTVDIERIATEALEQIKKD